MPDTAVLDPPADATTPKAESDETPKGSELAVTDPVTPEPTADEATSEENDTEPRMVSADRIEAERAEAAQQERDRIEAERVEGEREKAVTARKEQHRQAFRNYEASIPNTVTALVRELTGDFDAVATEAQIKRFRDNAQAFNRMAQDAADFHITNLWLDDIRAATPKAQHAELEALIDKEGTTTTQLLAFLAEHVAPATKAVKSMVNGLSLEDVKKSYPTLYKAIDDDGERLYKNGLAGKTRDGKRPAVRGEPDGNGTPVSASLTYAQFQNLPEAEKRKFIAANPDKFREFLK